MSTIREHGLVLGSGIFFPSLEASILCRILSFKCKMRTDLGRKDATFGVRAEANKWP